MSTQAIRVPQPLDSSEIRTGIAVRISNAVEGISDMERTELRDSIWQGLGKTCSLNRQAYASFTAKWQVFNGEWRVDYTLDDFGRAVTGTMSGNAANMEEFEKEFSGEIEAAPPDRFRRETNQPIPQPQVVQPKAENQAGVTKSVGRPKKVRET